MSANAGIGPCILCCLVWMLPMPVNAQRASDTRTAADYLEEMVDEEEVDAEALELLQSIMDDPIDLNSARARDLERLPGIDGTLARRIVRHRRIHGAYSSWSALRRAFPSEVGRLETIRPFIAIERHGRKRQRAYVATQWYTRRDADLPFRIAPRKAESIRRMTTRLSVRTSRGIGGRLTISRGGPGLHARLGGVEVSMFDERVSFVGGAYGVAFGAGLLLARGGMPDRWQFTLGRSVVREMRAAARSSVSSDDHLTGVAVRLSAPGGLTATGLYSSRPTSTENVSTVGVSLEVPGEDYAAGILAVKREFSQPRDAGAHLHERHRFNGSLWHGASMYVNRRLGPHRFSVEIAYATPGAAALVGSIGSRGGPRSSFLLLYRMIPSTFPILAAAPLSVATPDGTGEAGMLMAASASRGRFTLRLLADASRRKWASATAAWPGTGFDIRSELEWRASSLAVAFRLSHRSTPGDAQHIGTNGLGRLRSSSTTRNGARLRVDAEPVPWLRLRVHLEGVASTSVDAENSTGIHLYQQIRWTPARGVLMEARVLSFATESSDARMYVHETDVLYQPLLGVVSGDGYRAYVRGRLDVGTRVVFEAKVGMQRRTEAGESGELPRRTERLDARVQIRIAV